MQMNLIKKFIHRRKAAKIAAYLDKISAMPLDYRKTKKREISALLCLHAYYEGRTASSPRVMLESQIRLLRLPSENLIDKEGLCREIAVLYYWVHKGEIRGF